MAEGSGNSGGDLGQKHVDNMVLYLALSWLYG